MDDSANWLSAEQQQIWRSWLSGVARINQYLDADLRRRGLDLAEYEILVSLSEAEGRRLRMSDLAQQVHQSRSRLTHAIARLEQRGIVRRTSANDDRRGVYAHLTEAGFAVLEAAAPSHVNAVRDIFVDRADPEDFRALGRIMQQVLEEHV
ncbi:MAG: MarR family transcriptional regulator [Propionibacterium sp.]|nr:MarR family transcriptional regulator [Propionibacterium sp.]